MILLHDFPSKPGESVALELERKAMVEVEERRVGIILDNLDTDT